MRVRYRGRLRGRDTVIVRVRVTLLILSLHIVHGESELHLGP